MDKIVSLNQSPKEIPRVVLLEKSDGQDFPLNFRKHYHTHLLCLRGQVDFKLDGQKLTCKKDQFVFWIADNHLMTDLIFSNDFEAIILLVENQFMSENVPDQNWGIDAILHSRKYPVKQLADKNDRQRVLTNFHRMYNQFQDTKHRFYEEALKLQMRLFILEMWHTFANEYERRKRTMQSGTLYDRFIHLVEEHCMQEREVQFYAQQLHISAKYLNFISKQNSGITASEWIKRYAKERIILFLQSNHLNIAEIADEMEFSSRSFFTRYVKKLLGVTPSEYRNRLR